jgi:sec-independent protein translocase protein TatA
MPLSGIGPTELIVVLVIVLIVFGPKRLPEVGRSLGRGARELKQGLRGPEAPGASESDATGPKAAEWS